MRSERNTEASVAERTGPIELGPWLYAPLIFTATLFQKLALPGTANALPVGTIVMPIFAAVALIGGKARIDSLALFYFCLLLISAGISVLIISPGNDLSIPSLALLCCLQAPLATRLGDERTECGDALQFYSTMIFVFSIAGIAQFASEWFVPRPWSFPVDFYLPSSFRLTTYNNLIPLQYGATKLKSNGIFFAEPSFFGQAVAIGTIIELTNRKRPLRIAVFLAGLFVSYSGTGILILVPFGLYRLFRGRSFVPILTCALMALGLVLFGDSLNVDAITSRINEISTPGTSGYARFVSIFSVIQQYQLEDLRTTLFGIGSGQTSRFLKLLPYEGFGPTWGKVFFEYGAFGAFAYALFLSRVASKAQTHVRFPILVTYLFLGGYLGDSNVLIPMLLFVAWAPRTRAAQSAESKTELPVLKKDALALRARARTG